MQLPILKKITLVILAVSLGSILLSGLIINIALNQQFQFYLNQSQRARMEQVVLILADIYQDYNGWVNLPPQLSLGRGNNMMGGLRYVLDNEGRVVLTARPGMPLPDPNSLTGRPIIVAGQKVGTAYFGKTAMESLLSQQDQIFRATINRSILSTMLLTGAISFLVALLFARRISHPIIEMNRIARAMTAGRLENRIGDLPRDELGELGTSLNRLAERLQEVNELRKKMTSDVAHDLRTPLATVRSHLEGMIDRVIPASPENLESLLEEVNRLTGLVEDLQEIAQADLALRHFRPAPMELRGFLCDLVKKMTPLFLEQQLHLELQAETPITIATDRLALAKILDNLLTNARKYTPAGKVVTVALDQDIQDAIIEVIDQGIGITATDLPYIFERFYRTDQSRNRQSGGFGLGLTIVKELTEGLGGTVDVRSTPGQGSVFTVRLPLSGNGTEKAGD